jgi:uncharacterized protein (TIGR02246 family)
MKIRSSPHQLLIPAIALLCANSLPNLAARDAPKASPAAKVWASGDDGTDKAVDSLVKAAGSYVEAFNRRNAAAIAALFTPGGAFSGIDGETRIGREQIEACYSDLFAGDDAPMIALEATGVQFIAPGVAIEEGLVHLTHADDESVQTIGYTATHVEQADGSWLIASSNSVPAVATPAELIKPLHWMIGEWTLESEDGMRIEMVIKLGDRENYLLGDALITGVGQETQSTNLRIGWNPATSSVYWWTFDSEGGNSSGPWARRGDEWVVQTTGITADAEASSSSRVIVRDGDTMLWINTQRMLAGEALPDLMTRFVRRAPDPLSLIAPNAPIEPGVAKPAPATDGD